MVLCFFFAWCFGLVSTGCYPDTISISRSTCGAPKNLPCDAGGWERWNHVSHKKHQQKPFHQKSNGTLPNGPLSKLLELLDTHQVGVHSVGPVGDFLES